MSILRILQIPYSGISSEKKLKELYKPQLIVKGQAIKNDQGEDISTYQQMFSEYKVKDNFHIRIYTSNYFDKKEFQKLCHEFDREKSVNWLIIVSIDSDDNNRKNCLKLIRESDKMMKVMLTNKDSGDISFMPRETFWRSNWTMVHSPKEPKKSSFINTELATCEQISEKCKDIKNEVFSVYIEDHRIQQELCNLQKLLGIAKWEIPSAPDIVQRIKQDEEIDKSLQKIKHLTELLIKPLVDKTQYFENLVEKKHEIEFLHEGFIEMRRVLTEIFQIIDENMKARQHFLHAIYFAFKTKTSDEYHETMKDELCELFQIRSKDKSDLKTALKKHGLLEHFESMSDAASESERTKKLEDELHRFFQGQCNESSLSLINKLLAIDLKKKKKFEKIKKFVRAMFDGGDVNFDTLNDLEGSGYSGIRKILKSAYEACKTRGKILRWAEKLAPGLESDIKQIFKEGIEKSMDGDDLSSTFDGLLKLIPDESKRTEIGERLHKEMRKEDYEIFKTNYEADCKDNSEKFADERIALFVATEDEAAEDIRTIEVERTLHTGKFDHSGLDFVSKRMIKSFITRSEANKEKLVRFVNTLFHSYPFEMPEEVRQTCLRIKCDKWKKAELKYVYRPISMTTQFFNLVDKAMHLRLLDWIWENNGLPEYSFSYQKRKSAPWCRNHLLMKISQLIESKKCWFVTCVDFKQAYENVHPLKLCQIMTNRGIPSKIISWVWFTLRERKFANFRFRSNDRISRSRGVPQGSALSPLLFNIYTALIHDFVPSSNDTFIYQYTDDILVLGIDEDFGEAQRKSEATCNEVVRKMLKYDAVLKKKSVTSVNFVGLIINAPQAKQDCEDVNKIFESYFNHMYDKIEERIENTCKEISSPQMGWHMYHIKIRPLFSKVLLSIKIIRLGVSSLEDQITRFDELNVLCLQKCLQLKGDHRNRPHALRYEFGEFPAEIQMEESFLREFSYYFYYGLLNTEEWLNHSSETEKWLNHFSEIEKALMPVPRRPKYPSNIIVRGCTKRSNEWEEYDFVIFTDGSVSTYKEENVSGAAAYFAKPQSGDFFKSESVKLRKELMIGSAEIIAIVIGAEKVRDYLESNPNLKTAKILFCIDRQEPLLQLREKQKTRHIHYYVEKFKEIVRNLGTKGRKVEVILQWVHGHSKSKENNIADKLAKEASRSKEECKKFHELNLIDFTRQKRREMRRKYEEQVGSKYGEFRFKPWFQRKPSKALRLSSETCRIYIEDRLNNPNHEKLKNWKYYNTEYKGLEFEK